MQGREAVRYIKERISLVDMVRRYVDLQRNGPRWAAPCPFHQETKPSFSISEEEGFFYCFGCQASGDLFDFYGRINGLDFRETLEQLALEAGITLDAWQKNGPNGQGGQGGAQNVRQKQSARQNMLRMYALAEAHFKANLQGPDGEECRTYMQGRKLSPEIIETFGLGWAKREWQSLANALQKAGFSERDAVEAGLLGSSQNSGRGYDRFRGRLIFPIQSLGRQVIAFGGRIIGGEDEAKYINSSDSLIYKKGDQLYGLAQSRSSITIKGHVLLTEGYMDVLTLHQFGYTNAVGVLGTALTPEQIKRISGFTSHVILLFDGDRAGRKAALRSCEMLLTRGLKCSVVLLPEGEDIDSLLHSQGTEAFENLVKIAPDGINFCVQVLRDMAPKDAVDFAKSFLKKVEIPELISTYTSRFATGLQLSEESLRENISKSRSGQDTSMEVGKAGQNPQSTGLRHGSHVGPTGKPLSATAMLDKQIMMYAVRYPHRLQDLRNISADLALHNAVAKNLWKKIEEFGPEDVFHHLSEREKTFWIQSRTGEAPPRDQGDKELESLEKELENMHNDMQKNSLFSALRQNADHGNFEAELDYLRVLQETLRRIDE